MVKKMEEKQVLVINDYCKHRIKPKLIRDVKTEAVLVFARTALERFFKTLDKNSATIVIEDDENLNFVYAKLRELLQDLQEHVTNVDYLIELVQNAKKYPMSFELKKLAKYEEPLINYYDSMAKRMEFHFPQKTAAIPEFIVICVLSNWFLENGYHTNIYPFIEKYDFIELTEKFELFVKDSTKEKKNLINEMQLLSIDVVNILQQTKYKFNKERSSKRKRRK